MLKKTELLNAVDILVRNESNVGEVDFTLINSDAGLFIYNFHFQSSGDSHPGNVILEWKIPAVNIKGIWKPTADFSKRIEADWELEKHESRISIDAPILSLFGNRDENILCFSCSNAVNRVEMAAKYREEDNHFYCQIVFFTECKYPVEDFTAEIRLDYRKTHFSNAIQDTSKWWESYQNLKPAPVPDIATRPLYSTWYQFHQNLNEHLLLKECGIAKALGFDSIIIDDGWQTNDNNRGYDYTGDWLPERFPEMRKMVNQIQDLGLKVGIWYSVPFCGKKSKAYQKFKGKFLTENHRWAPVFDPRYPEVRDYLVNVYAKAAKEWDLDGFKLDFIDDFKSYPETSFEEHPGRDFLSINKAVDCLLKDVTTALREINPEIFIEFRQKYTGPAIRKYGNMLRAFDCPGDYTMNRVRIADIRMMAGATAVHADMVTWHFDETVENAAIHYVNTLFGVPQISVMLDEAPDAHLKMIKFYTEFWNEKSQVLLSQDFRPQNPTGNYPLQQVWAGDETIIGLYDDLFVKLDKDYDEICIINAKTSQEIVISTSQGLGKYECTIFDCMGNIADLTITQLRPGVNLLNVPQSGLVKMRRINN